MIDTAHSILVDPRVDYFYLGDFTGPIYDKIKLWSRYCPAPTEGTAEYDFTPAQDDYVAFLHTDDAKPTLLEYGVPNHVNMNTALDCVTDTLYGAIAWERYRAKVLVVNATKNAKGLHLSDILYQGTVDFSTAWGALPVTRVFPGDVRIDEDGRCRLLMTNELNGDGYYSFPAFVSEVAVNSDLTTEVAQNVISKYYSSGAEYISYAANVVPPGLLFEGSLKCNFNQFATASAVIQYATNVAGPWTDYTPADFVLSGVDVVASIPYAILPDGVNVYVRMAVTYGGLTLTGKIYLWHPLGGGGHTFALYSDITFSGQRFDIQSTRYGPDDTSIIANEIVRTYVNAPSTNPIPTETVNRIVQRAWADFWGTPVVIISSGGQATFYTGKFSDGTEALLQYTGGDTRTLYRYSGGVWSLVSLTALPVGYTDTANFTMFIDLENPVMVSTIIKDDPYVYCPALYDLTTETWSFLSGNIYMSETIAFNEMLDKLFFVADDAYWHCTSGALPSNAIWYMGI